MRFWTILAAVSVAVAVPLIERDNAVASLSMDNAPAAKHIAVKRDMIKKVFNHDTVLTKCRTNRHRKRLLPGLDTIVTAVTDNLSALLEDLGIAIVDGE